MQGYTKTLTAFRERLQTYGMDVAMSPDKHMDTGFVLALLNKRTFAILSKRPCHAVSSTTRNLRLAALSSFYTHAEKKPKIPFSKPIKLGDRSPSKHTPALSL